MAVINIARDFSSTPGGRFRVMGPASGEQFRELIRRVLKRNPSEVVEVVLDGVEGYGSSFLEEAFGGLVRHKILSPQEALKRIKIVARTMEFETYADEARGYIEDEVKKNG